MSTGKWTDYIKGVLAEFLERGLAAESLDILVRRTVPMGCGLSSSAALQVAMARLLQQLDLAAAYNEHILSYAKLAEHKFAGVPASATQWTSSVSDNARQDHVVYLTAAWFR